MLTSEIGIVFVSLQTMYNISQFFFSVVHTFGEYTSPLSLLKKFPIVIGQLKTLFTMSIYSDDLMMMILYTSWTGARSCQM